jgi:thioredoxin-like negative regulator of GroEL
MTDQKKTRREMLEELLTKKPEDAFARYGLAMECMNAGDAAGADGHFRHLVEHNATYVPAYLMYGQFLVREAREDDARKVLTSGIAAATQQRNDHARSEMESLLAEIS